MNTKRVAATVIALAITASCTIAQKADKDGQRKTQMEQIEKKRRRDVAACNQA